MRGGCRSSRWRCLGKDEKGPRETGREGRERTENDCVEGGEFREGVVECEDLGGADKCEVPVTRQFMI